jgi:hypothetical protein
VSESLPHAENLSPIDTTTGPVPPPAPAHPVGSVDPALAGSAGSAPVGSDAPVPTPKRKTGLWSWVGIVVLLLVLGGGYYWFNRNDTQYANVGDCLSGNAAQLDASQLKIVDCGSSEATLKVLEKVDNKTKAEADASCTNQNTAYVLWQNSNNSSTGSVLCLGPVK